MVWKCNNCGYTISEVKENIKRPICSGRMIDSLDIDKTVYNPEYANGGEHPMMLFISCFICITFPLLGPIILLWTTKNSVTGLDEESRYIIRIVSKVFLSVSIIMTVLFIMMSVISAFVFPNP